MGNIVLVDSNSFLYRNYYGYPPLYNNEGYNVNALNGYLKSIKKMYYNFVFDDIIHTLDDDSRFRMELMPEYKQNRPPIPEDLVFQKNELKNIIPHFNQKVLGINHEESDDVIASLAQYYANQGHIILILSNDKDMLQMLDHENIGIAKLEKTMEGYSRFVYMTPDEVINKYQIAPEQVADYLALLGDSVDNIKGISGVGKKKAAELLNQYGDIETLIQYSDEIGGKIGENIDNNKDNLILYKKLTLLARNLDIDPIDNVETSFDFEKYIDFLNMEENDVLFWNDLKEGTFV